MGRLPWDQGYIFCQIHRRNLTSSLRCLDTGSILLWWMKHNAGVNLCNPQFESSAVNSRCVSSHAFLACLSFNAFFLLISCLRVPVPVSLWSFILTVERKEREKPYLSSCLHPSLTGLRTTIYKITNVTISPLLCIPLS